MSLKGNTTAEKIWNFLISKGLNECGAAGLMGNLKAESALNPMNLQQTYERKLGHTDASYTAAVDAGTYTNFVKDSAGYGLAQWTYWSRKEKLLNYARSCKASIGNLEMQLCFLWKELSESYGSVLTTLKNAKTIREASDAVLLKYERPANQGTSVQQARAAYGQEFFDQFAAKINTGKEGGIMTTKISTAAELARRAIDVAKNHKTLYVMGCFGAPMNEKNKARYRANHSYNKAADRQAMISAASADTFGFDCVCLIKGLLWGWSGDASKIYGGASYKANNVPDIGADSMITVCKEVSTDFSSIEIGEAVWMKGNMPAVTEYTVNHGGYSDDPDFRPYLTSFPVPEGTPVKGAVLICPGGAFQFRSDQPEGVEVAEALRELGYQSFVVDYRLRPYTQQESALDLARSTVRPRPRGGIRYRGKRHCGNGILGRRNFVRRNAASL